MQTKLKTNNVYIGTKCRLTILKPKKNCTGSKEKFLWNKENDIGTKEKYSKTKKAK